ncbi:hypothetical protein [Pontibacter vulgaris]|uniref:hypothetical protein n=1 Tax=Pontibacter vulgaris TaxID=2905679 RepID=UPI001FA7BCEA|nr:hypothetical protein [Pontibacter vulgaris]
MEYLENDSLIIFRSPFTKKIISSTPLMVAYLKLTEEHGIKVKETELTIELVVKAFEKPGGYKVEYYEVVGDLINLYVSTHSERLFGPEKTKF